MPALLPETARLHQNGEVEIAGQARPNTALMDPGIPLLKDFDGSANRIRGDRTRPPSAGV